MKMARSIAGLAVAALAVTLLPSAAQAAAPTVTVDYSSALEQFTRTGAGIHYGFSEDASLPTNDVVDPLKLNLVRGAGSQLKGENGEYGWAGDGLMAGSGFERRMDMAVNTARRVDDLGGRYVLLLNDLWGLDAWQPANFAHPCDWSNVLGDYDCSNYIEFLDTVIDRVQAENLSIDQWEIQNEPENYPFWNRGFGNAQYYKMWDSGYRHIKSRIPDAKLVGPSWVTYNYNLIGSYLDHVKAEATVPDVLNWHGLITRQDPATDTAHLRQMLEQRGIDYSEMEFSINEYLTGGNPDDRASGQLNPGSTAYYLTRLNDGGVTHAARGIFPLPSDDTAFARAQKDGFGDTFCCEFPNLAGLIPVGKPDVMTDEYWLYHAYGEMAGTRYAVQHTNPAEPWWGVVGTATAEQGQAMVMLGADNGFTGGALNVDVNGLDALQGVVADGKVEVQINRIPFTGGALKEPEVVSRQVVAVNSGSITLPISWTAKFDAYVVYLSAPGAGSETVYPNQVVNPGFEVDEAGTQTPSGWSETGSVSSGFTEGKVGSTAPRSGAFRYTQADGGAAHDLVTSQVLTVPNGTYTASAWAVSGGGQDHSYMQVSGFGNASKRADIVGDWSWRKLTISDIVVTDGTLTVAFATKGLAGQWVSIDDVDVRMVTPAVPEPALAATATSRCVAGKVVVAVSVTNTGAAVRDTQVTTAWGSKTLTLATGQTKSQAFSTRAASIDASIYTVSTDGIPVTTPVEAHTCN